VKPARVDARADMPAPDLADTADIPPRVALGRPHDAARYLVSIIGR
jgi:hypothetical protein